MLSYGGGVQPLPGWVRLMSWWAWFRLKDVGLNLRGCCLGMEGGGGWVQPLGEAHVLVGTTRA